MEHRGAVRLRSDRIVGPSGTVAGEVVIEQGRILSVGAVSPGTAIGQDEVVDLGDRWLIPGFIDGHVHGGGGAQCNTAAVEEVGEMARFHAGHGTTGLLATTVPAPVDELCVALGAIAGCAAPNLLGAHLEGPFLSPERSGALDPDYFVAPDLSKLERLLRASGGGVRMMTLAPELPGAVALVRHLDQAGVLASVGHTNATYAEVQEAARAGARAATHLFNAMPPFHHRRPGPVGAALDLPEISCELICDGVHVDPVAMRMAYRSKGPSGVRLVTDAIAAAGMPDGEYRLGGRAITVSGGRARLSAGASIAGSTLTMDAALRNAVEFLRVPVEEAVLMSSTNPARLLGLDQRKGTIAPGLDADLVVLSERLTVEATMIAGSWVGDPP
jgi:N-acetylglucosamine-6-phosphate deacetylase